MKGHFDHFVKCLENSWRLILVLLTTKVNVGLLLMDGHLVAYNKLLYFVAYWIRNCFDRNHLTDCPSFYSTVFNQILASGPSPGRSWSVEPTVLPTKHDWQGLYWKELELNCFLIYSIAILSVSTFECLRSSLAYGTTCRNLSKPLFIVFILVLSRLFAAILFHLVQYDRIWRTVWQKC